MASRGDSRSVQIGNGLYNIQCRVGVPGFLLLRSPANIITQISTTFFLHIALRH